MKTSKKSRILSLVLAIVMMLSIVPMSIFAAEADDPVLQDGKVAISNDMTDDEIRVALFNALVSNPEGKNPLDYDWDYKASGKCSGGWKNYGWGNALTGWETKYSLVENAKHPKMKDHPDIGKGSSGWEVRIAGMTDEQAVHNVTLVNTCNITVDYQAAQGAVTINGENPGGDTKWSPKASVNFVVTPAEGYNIKSVTVNGKEIKGTDGVYNFVPVAETNVQVLFEEVANTHSTLTVKAAEGVTYKYVTDNGEWDLNGSAKVSNSADTTVKFITDANTSIAKVLVDGEDKTAEVKFDNYNGEYTATFAADATIEVETVKSAITLTGKTVVPVIADQNGDWDYVQIREAIIDTLVSADSTIGAIDKDKIEVKYNCKTTDPDVWVDLDYDSSLAWEWTFEELFKYTGSMGTPPKAAEIRLMFTGDGQYRPTEYVYETITIDDLNGSSIAVRTGVQEFELKEIAQGKYDYEALRQAIYNAVIDEANSYPKGAVTYDNIELTYKILDAMGSSVGIGAGDFYEFEQGWLGSDAAGTYKYLYKGGQFTIKATLPSTENYYGTEVEFDVKVTPAGLPTAEIALKGGEYNLDVELNYDRSYDVDAFLAAMKEAVIDAENSKYADNIRFVYEFTPNAAGAYTVNVKAVVDGTDEFYGTEKDFTVKVNVVDNYTAEIVYEEPTAHIPFAVKADHTFNYEQLKQDMFNAVIKEVKNVEGLTWADFDYSYDYVRGAINTYVPFETTKEDLNDPAGANYYITDCDADGYNFKITLKDKAGAYYGDSIEFVAVLDKVDLPKIDLKAKADQTVTLNYTLDRSFNYAQFKADIINNVLSVAGLPEGVELTADDYEIQYKWTNGLWYQYDTIDRDCTVEFWAKIKDGNGYYGDEVYFNMTVVTNDEFTSKIALKDNYQRDFTLYYNDAQEFDYERLHRELFDAIIDTNNSSSNVTFENTVVTYDVTDGMAIHYPDSPLNTVGSDVGDPAETLFTYLHEGGTFTVKFAVPNSGGLFGNSVSVSLNIGPFGRQKTSVVLNGNAEMDYVASPAAVKQYIFDNVISKELSILPEGVTVDDFVFEYWAQKYLAGGTPGAGTDMGWAPFEGRDDIMGTYYEQIGAGDNYYRVYYKGNAKYEPSPWTSGYEIISLPKADFDISLKQDYIYKGDQLPKDFVQMSGNTSGADMKYRMLFTTTTNAGNALVYLQSRDGYNQSDFILDLQTEVIINVFHGAKTGESILREGLSIDEYKQLINSPELAAYFAKWYDMTEADMEVFRTAAFSRLGGMNHVIIRLGTPAHAAHYDVFVGAYNKSFNTQVMHSGMYVKYNSKGAKLIWRESATGLNTINSRSFDFGADATKDGISQSDGNVKYLYTGLFYCSSQPPRGKAGFFVQTAWTKAGTMYCFPQTRSFTIKVL